MRKAKDMEYSELLSISDNLMTTSCCMKALAAAHNMTQDLMGEDRVSGIRDMSEDHSTVPDIALPSKREPITAYAFQTSLADCTVCTCMISNSDGVTCGIFVPDTGIWMPYQWPQPVDEDTDPEEIGGSLFDLTYETLFDQLDLKHMHTIEL